MKRLTAAISNGTVVDVEAWDDSANPGPRSDGLARTDCPWWVSPGCVFDGSWKWSDGQPPVDSLTRRTWTAREFDERVEIYSPGSWDRLAAAALNTGIPDETRALIRRAIRQSEKATTIESDHPDTLQFIGAAVALGVLTEEQAFRIVHWI